MPDGVKGFTPLQILLLLCPLLQFKNVSIQTNLYFLQKNPDGDHNELMTVRELFVWIGLHLKMMRNWGHSQDNHFGRPGRV